MTALGIGAVLLSLAVPVSGQRQGTARNETAAAAKPWPPQRLPDGQPDVQGFFGPVQNGTPHPPGHIDWWMGDSRGRWEGDTLAVDLIHFNDQTWFDKAGNFHSDALHEVERYTLLDADHINYEVTIEDPKVFTRPWKKSMILYRHKEKNFRLLDYECYGFDFEPYYPYPGR